MFDEIPMMRTGVRSLSSFLAWLPLENAHVLEIGCFAGDGTVEFLQCDKIQSVDCVDMFAPGYDPADTASACDMDHVMQKWMLNVSRCVYDGPAKPVTLRAFQESDDVPRGLHFDLCYIDGNHLQPFVHADIMNCLNRYSPKVIAGHDYGVGKHPGVKLAVDNLFAEDQLKIFPDSSWAVVL